MKVKKNNDTTQKKEQFVKILSYVEMSQGMPKGFRRRRL